jgi:hypothetical protein
MALEISGA